MLAYTPWLWDHLGNLPLSAKGEYYLPELVNMARGEHLVEDDLIELLADGHMAGATLDVFRTEPLPAQHPFRGHPLITLTPHASARTLPEESIAQIAAKLRALEQGIPVQGLVDLGRGY